MAQSSRERETEGIKETVLIPTIVYAARVKDRELLERSSSGGAFTAISDYFLEDGNAVVCAIYNYELHQTEFCLVTDKKAREQALGSKYMQSNPGIIYKTTLQWLKDKPDKMLLFVGMGCQADGFRKFAETMRIRDRVIVVDIICHGTPSPKLWREYANVLENKHNGKIKYLTFKDKRNGWNHPTAVAQINGVEISLREYVKIFYNKCALRPSCHECPYATTERKTDITIGDFWHIEKTIPDFYDPQGTSVFLIHTEQGLELFDRIKDNLEYCISNTEECWQINLERPTEKSPMREQFWSDYQAKGIEFIMKKYGNDSLHKKVKNKLKRMFGGGCLTDIYGTDTEFSETGYETYFIAMPDLYGRTA
ncbi:MAG: Coenzyme F420 hydrogenase/dehydrogenase, beta subunit C-terminal domain [Lachnospiraceae bacterium]|nr:Coenzyme F420 hydrogenase/dehydrogenase, beta subunit C-terminal domain [Lachnospiraceae bacterium]